MRTGVRIRFGWAAHLIRLNLVGDFVIPDTAAQSKPMRHIPAVEQSAAAGDPLAGEIPAPASTARPLLRLPSPSDWLSTNRHCPCEPRKMAEEELARKVEELARSNRELEQFAFVASHDLQEPLRMVAAYTQLLAEKYRGKLDANADLYIAYASEGALRMQTLIQDLLAFSRVARADTPLREVDSNLALDAALQNLKHFIEQAGALIQRQPLPRVFAERSLLAQVFQNLIGNAIKFRREQPPTVSVQATHFGKDWLFSVRDNGIGIEPEHSETVFAIFQRLHTRAEYPGNGIGLAICKRIVERFHGRIWLESRPGEGSTFQFTLPAAGGETGGAAQ